MLRKKVVDGTHDVAYDGCMTITLYSDHHKPQSFASKADALAEARARNAEAFEIFDEVSQASLHVEYPKARWI